MESINTTVTDSAADGLLEQASSSSTGWNGSVEADWNASSQAAGWQPAQRQPTEADVKHAVLIFYAIMLTMIGAQSGLFWWKRRHKRSYELVTLFGLWVVPAVLSLHLHFWRFCLVWLAYSSVTGYWLYKCTFSSRLDPRTPRQVYAWFLGVYRVSVALGGGGYLLLLAEMFGAGPLLRLALPPTTAVLLVWYGLYFGVLGRDCAEVTTNRMVAVMGTGRKLAVSVKDCGICGGELKDMPHLAGQQDCGSQPSTPPADKVVQLACKHLFHDPCIRGWTIVGKKDTCPVCKEKVDLRAMYADRPWETRNLTWIQMLDAVRYLVVWNPIILIGLHFALRALGVDQRAAPGGRRDLPHHPLDYPAAQHAAAHWNGTLA